MPNEELNTEFPSNSKFPKRNKTAGDVAPMRPESKGEIAQARRRPATRAKAIRKKRTFVENVASLFLGNTTRNAAQYIIYDVLIPAAKNTAQDMLSQGLEILLFGDTRGRGRSGDRDRSTGRSVVSYNRYYEDRRERERPRPRPSTRFNLEDIYFARGNEADDVLEFLCDHLEKYDQVTVADYFEAAGIDGATWVHNKWGWDNLRNAYCTHTRDGYTIVLPDPIELD